MRINWDFLKSRAFWSSVGPLVASLCILFEVSEAKTAAIVAVVTSCAGFFAVTGLRKKKQEPTSYAEMQRLLEVQSERIEALRKEQE